MAVIGGGQLARMMAAPAISLGIELRVLREGPGAAARVIPGGQTGAANDPEALRNIARGADVVTVEHEHVPGEVLSRLGTPAHPGAHALLYAQNKLQMRRRLTKIGIGCPRWAEVKTVEDIERFAAAVGWPLVLKTPVGGYDGKGVAVVRASGEAQRWLEGLPQNAPSALAEELVDFKRELAVLVARGANGEVTSWPVVQTEQRNGVCTEVIAPAPLLSDLDQAHLRQMAIRIAQELDVTGVMAVEIFQCDGAFLVNELAMRPHNSGHWTINGAVTSQFEQHLRAVAGWPLGATATTANWTVMVNLFGPATGEDGLREAFAAHPGVKIEMYGKQPLPGRKIGHVNATGDNLDNVVRQARGAAQIINGQELRA